MTAPVLPIYVDVSEGLAQLRALRADIVATARSLSTLQTRETRTVSPLVELRTSMVSDLAFIKKQFESLGAAAASGIGAGKADIAKALNKQTEQIAQIIEASQKKLRDKAGRSPPLRFVNPGTDADVSAVKAQAAAVESAARNAAIAKNASFNSVTPQAQLNRARTVAEPCLVE